jgi:hypothetical protein
MSVPIFTYGANNQLIPDYTPAQLKAMVAPERQTRPDIPSMIVPNVPPPIRGDLQQIYQYNALNEHSARWEAQQHKVQAKDVDSLLRAYLVEQIDNENARRAKIEADSEMPYAGVVADILQKKKQVDNVIKDNMDDVRRRKQEAETRRAEAAAMKAEADASRAAAALLKQQQRDEEAEARRVEAAARRQQREEEELDRVVAKSPAQAAKAPDIRPDLTAVTAGTKSAQASPAGRAPGGGDTAVLVEQALPGAAGGAGAASPVVTTRAGIHRRTVLRQNQNK